jgi:hypothetical protein
MLEVICRGRPPLVEPVVFRMAMRLGLATAGVTGWPAGSHYRILRVGRPPSGETPDQPIAVVELQEIPGERTALFFGPIGEPNPQVEAFGQALLQELVRFEFVALPESQKGRIGFHVEPADELTGARLLETFDAINSAAPPTYVPAPPAAGGPSATSGSSPGGEPAPPPGSDR